MWCAHGLKVYQLKSSINGTVFDPLHPPILKHITYLRTDFLKFLIWTLPLLQYLYCCRRGSGWCYSRSWCKISVIVKLNLNTAFDTADDKILLGRQKKWIEPQNTVLKWFKKYLQDKNYFKHQSPFMTLKIAVSQNSHNWRSTVSHITHLHPQSWRPGDMRAQ